MSTTHGTPKPKTHADHGRANLASATILLGVAAVLLSFVGQTALHAVEMLGGAA